MVSILEGYSRVIKTDEDDTEQAAEGVTPESALAAAAAALAPKKEKKGPLRIKKEEAGDAPF